MGKYQVYRTLYRQNGEIMGIHKQSQIIPEFKTKVRMKNRIYLQEINTGRKRKQKSRQY